jgi:hypothetical protein
MYKSAAGKFPGTGHCSVLGLVTPLYLRNPNLNLTVSLAVCGSFNDAFRKIMINELGRVLRKRSWPNLKYYPGGCLGYLRKTTNLFSQNSLSRGRDLNPGSPEKQEC